MPIYRLSLGAKLDELSICAMRDVPHNSRYPGCVTTVGFIHRALGNRMRGRAIAKQVVALAVLAGGIASGTAAVTTQLSAAGSGVHDKVPTNTTHRTVLAFDPPCYPDPRYCLEH